jgi:hypothetical protein
MGVVPRGGYSRFAVGPAIYGYAESAPLYAKARPVPNHEVAGPGGSGGD